MGWKVQRKNIKGGFFAPVDIPECKVRKILPEAVICDIKLGRYKGNKNETPYAKYTYEHSVPLGRGCLG